MGEESDVQPEQEEETKQLDTEDDGNAAVTIDLTSAQDDEDQLKRDQTTAQLNAINDEIREQQALTSERFPVSNLVEQYIQETAEMTNVGEAGSTEPVNYFLQGACYLSQKYGHYRRVRGDGNCYYRAFLYAVLENLLEMLKKDAPGAKDELQRLKAFAKESFETATSKFGYDKFALEMFQEEFMSILETLSYPETVTQEDLHKRLNEEGGTSEYCTWYMRVLTACQLKSDPERFAAFLWSEDFDDYIHNPHVTPQDNIADFCLREVEPMGKECGMVQVSALAEIMKVGVSIEYLDGRPFNEEEGLTLHQFGLHGNTDSSPPKLSVSLLYRPGHYDVLYK